MLYSFLSCIFFTNAANEFPFHDIVLYCIVLYCIGGVKLLQLSVGAFLHINTDVILCGDVIKANHYGSSRNEGVSGGKWFVGN